MDWNMVAAVVAAVVAICGLIVYGMKTSWFLSEKFAEIKDSQEELLAQHEKKDQERHEDNIQRFAALEAKLSVLIRNGSNVYPWKAPERATHN